MTRSNSAASVRSKLLRTSTLAGGVLAGMCLMAAPAVAQPAVDALPTGGVVADQSGGDTIGITVNGGTDTMTVDLGDNEQSIINWTTFDVGANADVDYTVDFATQGAVLNRVIGGTFSQIYGGINGPSNLTVFLINPNGIVFGPTGAANVGGLIASTLDLADADFMNGSAYNFTGTATTGVSVLAGANLSTGSGPLVLLGGFASNLGTLSGGNVVMAAASDVTMTLAAGSPLSMTINQGTPLSGTVVEAGGTINGTNVYLAVASRTGVLDALLSVTGTVSADTALATDRGIVLAAGTSASGITVATAGGNDTAGPARIDISGTLDADDNVNAAVANIEIRSTGNVTGSGAVDSEDLVNISSSLGDVSLSGADAIDAGDGITVSAAGGVFVANASAASGDIALTGASLGLNNTVLDAQNGNITLTGPTQVFNTNSVTASGGVLFDGTVDGPGTLDVDATGTEFNGNVGATTALESLSVVGPVTLSGSEMSANNGIVVTTGLTLDASMVGTALIDADADADGIGDLQVGGLTGTGAFGVYLNADSILTGSVTNFTQVFFNGTTQLLGDVDTSESIAFQGDLLLAGGGADQSISSDLVIFAGSVDGASDLTVDTTSGAFFDGIVGGTTALQSLDVIGDATINASTVRANGDIDLDDVTVGPQALVTIIADANANGTGALTISGNIVAGSGGTTSLGLTGDTISVANVGEPGGEFIGVTFSGTTNDSTTTLSGDVDAVGHVQVNTDLILTGAGVRTISGASATFGDSNQDDIWSSANNTSGLAVSVTGAADFNGDIGLDGNRLSAFGLGANTLDFDILDNSVRANVLAVNVATGNILLPATGSLTIGTVGPVNGLSTGNGTITVSAVTPGGGVADLTVNGDVQATGNVSLSAEGALTGTGDVTSTGASVTLAAGNQLNLGNVSAFEDVTASGNGLIIGAITATNATSDITLNGGAGGIGNGSTDLSINAGGNITLLSAALGRDIALLAGGSITTGDLTARDDISVWAQGGIASLGAVTSGTTVSALGPVDVIGAADTLFALDLTGNDISIAGDGLNFGAVRANGANSDIRIDSENGIIGAGSRDLDLAAGGDIVLFDNVQGRDIALVAGGSISGGVGLVNVTARDDIAIIAGTNATLGTITVGATVDALTATDVAGAADPHLPASFSNTGNDLVLEAQDLSTTYSLTGVDDFALTDTLGGLTLSTGITVGGTLNLTAENGNLDVGAVTLSAGEDINLTTVTSGDINLTDTIITTPTSPGHVVTLTSAGDIDQTGGGITTYRIAGSSVGVTRLLGNNDFEKFSLDAQGGLGLFDNDGFDIDESIESDGVLEFFTPAYINVQADVTAGGAVLFDAGTFITINADVSGTDLTFLADTGPITQTGGAITGTSLTGSSAGAVTLTGANNDIDTLLAFTANGFAFVDTDGLTIGGVVNGGANGVDIAAGGDLVVNADVLATNGPIALSTDGANSDIILGAAVNAGTGTVTLDSGGNVGQTAAGVVTAGTLTGSAGGLVDLTGATNQITNLGAFTANGFVLLDAGGLTVTGGVDGSGAGIGIETSGDLVVNAGLTADNSPIALDATGAGSDILLSAAVDAGTGGVSLNSGGLISQTAAAPITAGSLDGSAAGAVTLNLAANDVANLGPFTSVGFAFLNTDDLTVSGDINSGSGAVSIQVNGNPLTVNADLLGSQVALVATGISQGEGSVINAGAGTVSLDANDGAVDLQGSITTTNGTATAVTIVDATDAALGSITTGAGGTVTLGGAAGDSLSGDVSQNGALVTGTLTGNVGGTATLTNAGNQVANLGAFTAGSLLLNDSSGGLTIGGDLTIADELELNSSGAIDQTAGIITAGSISGSSVGGASFDSAGNVIAGLGDFTNTGGGGFTLVTTVGLTMTGDFDAGTGDLSLTAVGIDFTGQTVSAGGNIVFDATTADLLGGTVTAGGSVTGTGDFIDIAAATATAGAITLTSQGDLTLGTGEAGTDITLTATNTIASTSLTAGGEIGATGADIDIDEAGAGGDITYTATGGVTFGSAEAGGAINLDAGGLLSGGLADAGGAITGTGATIDIDSASAGGAIALTADGDLTLGAGDAGGDVTLTAGGALSGGDISSGADFTGTGTSIDLGSANATGALSLTSDGNLTLATGGSAGTTADLIGTMVDIGDFDGGTTVNIEATDLEIGSLSASESVHILNAGEGTTLLGSAEGEGLHLSEAEINGIDVATLTIQSDANDIEIGDLAFATGAGSSRINLLTSGRIDVTGAVTTEGSTADREVQVGGIDEDDGQSSVIRIAATADGGGRLLMGDAVLHLRGAKIGVGQDAEFLQALGLVEGGTPASVDTVAQDYVGDATSRLYVAASTYNLNNATLVSASSMTVTYNDYALFQNTALPGTIPSGVVIGSLNGTGTLTLNSSGEGADNAFSMSGEINGRRGVETAVLGPNFIILNGVNLNNSRLNGCIVGSGANCIINIVATPFFNFFDESRADVLSAGRDLTLTLDPVVGANNEALFSGFSSVSDPAAEGECDPQTSETPCPASEEKKQ